MIIFDYVYVDVKPVIPGGIFEMMIVLKW